MRKFVIGLILGVGIASSFNVYAAVESLIGKEVQGEVGVKLNGAPLDNKAAIVDGSSYLPVRAIGEALGLNVDFQNNEVIINQQQNEVKPLVTDSAPSTTPPPVTKVLTLKQVEDKIELTKINIQGLKMGLDSNVQSDPRNAEYKERLAKYEAELAELEKQKAALQP